MNYIKKLYHGRINRKHYGLGLLFFISSFKLSIVFTFMFLSDNSFPYQTIAIIILYISFIIHLFSLHARRFHDLGKNAWKVFLLFIPVVNLIILISLLIKKGEIHINKYGEPPLKFINFFDSIFNRNQDSDLSINNKNKDIYNQYCIKCGTQCDTDSKFCYKCGTKIIDE